MSSRLAIVLILTSLLLSGIRAVEAQSTNPALEPVTLQLKWQHQFQFAGYYAAVEQGFYREAGLDVTIIEADEDTDPIQTVIDGEADFGVGTTELVLWRSRGAPVVVLGVIFQHSPLVLLTTERDDILSTHDLVGKRVAIEPNSAELLTYLQNEGIDTADIDMLPHSLGTSELVDGAVDAMSAYSSDEPFELQSAGIAYQTFSPRSAGIDFYGDVLFTTQAQIDASPERVRAFTEASMAGWRYAFDHQDEMIDYIYTELSQRHSREHLAFEAEQMCRHILPDLIEPGYMYTGRWQYIVDTYVDVGLLDRSFDVRTMLYQPNVAVDLGPLYRTLAFVAIITLVIGGVSIRVYRLYRQMRRQSHERERAQRLLADSEARYRSLVEYAPFPVVISRRSDDTIRYVNTQAEQLLYVRYPDVSGQPAVRFYTYPENRTEIIQQLADNGGNLRNFETYLQPVDGVRFWASLSATVITYEGEPSLFFTFSDLSERHHMEEQLRESEALYRSILHASPDAIAITDLECRFVKVSPSWLSMFGYAHEDALRGRQMQDWIVPEERPRADSDLQAILEEDGGGRTEFLVVHSDGHHFQIEVASEVIRDAAGTAQQLVFILRDITERKQAEAQAFELAVEQERIKMLTGFIQNASHEFRTPLSVISSSSYLMSRSDELARREQYAARVIEQVMLINRLIDMLTQVALLDSDAPLRLGPVDIVELVRAVVAEAQEDAKQADIALTLATKPPPFLPALDAEQIKSALRHLLENAIRYTKTDGQIDVRLYSRNMMLILEVKDSGIGIAPDALQYIFEHFWRQDVAHSTPGFGLGLALTRRIAEAHGGSIEVESIVGSGSLFRISLPLRKPHPSLTSEMSRA